MQLKRYFAATGINGNGCANIENKQNEKTCERSRSPSAQSQREEVNYSDLLITTVSLRPRNHLEKA